MAIGSEPEIGKAFTVWGRMTPEQQQAWFDDLRRKAESGNILEGYATLGYPKRKNA